MWGNTTSGKVKELPEDENRIIIKHFNKMGNDGILKKCRGKEIKREKCFRETSQVKTE